MIKSHLKSVLKVACGLVLVFALLGLAACNNDTAQPAADENLIGTDTTQEIIYPAIRVGTLSTDDLLPLWVAQAEGLLEDAGLDVEIITFQSPPEQLAAITAGEVDALMTDMVVATLLHESGTPVRAVTKMAGAPAGIVAGPDSGIESLADLANVPVGASTPTVIEYIIDKALLGAGVPEDQIAYEVIPALSTRFQMLMEGNIKAAGLPWTLQSLAAQQGATVLLDREAATAFTSTVLVFSQDFIDGNAATGEGTSPEVAGAALDAMLKAWDAAVDKINASPDDYRELLIEKANLPEPLRETYAIPTYPKTSLPEAELWDSILEWMHAKEYLSSDVSYTDLVWNP